MNDSMVKARLIGLGSYVPQKILTNQDLEKLVDTSDEWIFTRTGIRERHIAAEGEYPSDMGVAAAQKALERCGVSAEEIDLIITPTMLPDYTSPSTAALIQHRLGATRAAAFDISAACSGYLYALSVAKAYVESGVYRRVLIVATETMSRLMDYTDRTTCVVFGDGASASVIAGEGAGFAIDGVCLGADGATSQLAWVPGGGARRPASHQTVDQRLHCFRMEGKEVFKQAVRRMEAVSRQCLLQCGLTEADVAWVVPHQANSRIIEAMAKRFCEGETQVYNVIERYGNTSAASVPIALDDLLQEQRLEVGQRLLLTAFGAGLTWGAAVLTKVAGEGSC